MRHTLKWIVLGCLMASSVATHAHGPYRGHWGWGYDPWFSSFVMGAAIGGTAVYLSRPYPPVPAPTVFVTSPPVVVMNAPPVYTTYGSYTTISQPVPVVEAYYCREAAQYYPAVQTCPSTWMLVRTP